MQWKNQFAGDADAVVDVFGRIDVRVTLHAEGLLRACSLQGARAERFEQHRSDASDKRQPQLGSIRIEDQRVGDPANRSYQHMD